MFRVWWGVVPLELDPGVSVAWKRRAASTVSCAGPVVQSGRILPFLAIEGRSLEIEGRRLVVGPDSDTRITGGFGFLPVRIGGSVLVGWSPRDGEVPRKGDWVWAQDGAFRFDGYVQDWSFRVESLLPSARWELMDATYALLDVVQDPTLLVGMVEVGDAVSAIAGAVGLTVVGEVPAGGAQVDVELRVGERWLGVLRRVAAGRWWRVQGQALDFSEPGAVWRGEQFADVSIRPLRDARGLTVGVASDGTVVGVLGAGRPQASVAVESLGELARVHATFGVDAVTVTATSPLPGVLPAPGEVVTVVVPGRGARHRCAIQSVGLTVGEGDERHVRVEALSVGAVEDPQYG